MALLACRECGAGVSSAARACPHCGFKAKRTRWWLWLPLIGAGVVFGGGAI